MTTYDALLGEPVDILHPQVRIYAVDDNEGLPIRMITLNLTPGEGSLELPRGKQGIKGDKGEPAAPYKLRGDKTAGEIGSMALGEGEKGWAFRNTDTNALHYWTGTAWIVLTNAFGAAGPQGPPGDIANVTIAMVAEGEPAHAYLSGPEGAQTLNLEIPEKRGPQGPQGPSAAISTAADYDNTTAPKVGDLIVRGPSGKWRPGSAPYVRMYSVPEGAFTDSGDVSNGSRVQIASYPLDALTFDTTLEVQGHLLVGQGLISQAEIEVRLGNVSSGVLIGKGLTTGGSGNQVCRILPHFSSGASGDTKALNTTPDKPLGVVPASHTGTAGTVYVSLVRKSGLTSVRAFSGDAQLIIKRYPKVQ